jgi:two-component system KDP operon response regulator KdpE
MQRNPDKPPGWRARRLNRFPEVLVVDSDPGIWRLLRPLLEFDRHNAVWTRNGADGLMAATANRPAAIILELDLPDGDGCGVLGALRTWSDVPVLALSMRTKDEDRIRALRAGANDYLVKPFSREDLATHLRVLLHGSSAEGDVGSPPGRAMTPA